jgi:hypothetical protein
VREAAPAQNSEGHTWQISLSNENVLPFYRVRPEQREDTVGRKPCLPAADWFPLVFTECRQDNLVECYYLLKLIREYATRRSALFEAMLKLKWFSFSFYEVAGLLSEHENNRLYVLRFASFNNTVRTRWGGLYSAPLHLLSVWGGGGDGFQLLSDLCAKISLTVRPYVQAHTGYIHVHIQRQPMWCIQDTPNAGQTFLHKTSNAHCHHFNSSAPACVIYRTYTVDPLTLI